jgi:hypothetical protein
MGHFYPEQQSKLVVELAGKPEGSTVANIIATAQRRKVAVSCAEAAYTEKGHQEWAVWMVLQWHLARGHVRLFPAGKAQRKALERWEEGPWDESFSDGDAAAFNAIRVKEVPSGEMSHVTYLGL